MLGVGFYGRSFHLADTECISPGCPFKGDAKKGDCTKSSGTLAYFEIMDIIKKQNINVTYDADAAVNYITFGDNMDQWVSYDSNRTFQQKLDYADEVGLGGIMIWSVDQDDSSFSALESLIGKSLPSYQSHMKRSSTVDANSWKSLNGEACKVSDCIDGDSNPPSGYGLAPDGKFPDKCSGSKYKFVWCPLNEMPSECEWRGSGSCHGQCHEAEVTLAHSPHGDTKCAAPGQQAFCCKSNTWAKLGAANCGWADTCDTCPNDRPYAVSSKESGGLFSKCTLPWCCSYDFENCHWVGKGTCDDNECSSTDVQVGLDPAGDTGSKCANGWSNRKKPLCCNAPKNSNPFLPVPLKNLFPTLPPTEDVPVWDKQSIKGSTGDAQDAFFFILIDGPSDVVTNLNKRDGSHLEFVTGGVHHGQATQTAHFVCLDDSADSNCDDIHLHGLEGKVLRMPDDLGFAKYAVAHAVTVSNYTVPQERLSKRAPEEARVYELTYSYDFSKVKRAASKDVYIRVDYADSKDYWEDVVEASPSKRGLQSRFYSKYLSVWKKLLQKIRNTNLPNNPPNIANPDFDVSIYESNGASQGCDNSGWLKVGLKGQIVSVFRFGFTFVGKLQPFRLEEAYGFFDSNPGMKATLNFDGKGILDINNGRGAVKDLFSSSVTGFEGHHPGIISFSPQLNAQISMVGSGEIDANFSADFDAGASTSLTNHAPSSLGDFEGNTQIGTTIRDAVTGHVYVGEDAPDSVFSFNVNLESALDVKIFDYGRSSIHSGARFAANAPRTIRVASDTGSGKPGIVVAPQQASSEVVPYGDSSVISSWDDYLTHPLGNHPKQFTIFTGGDKPSDREPPIMSDTPIFSGRDFMTCTDFEWSGSLTCTYDISDAFPGLTQPDLPYRKRSNHLEAHIHHLNPRAGGQSGGGTERYPVYEAAAAGPANVFDFETPTYPNGGNGQHLNTARGRTDAYGFANPQACDDPSITANGALGVNYNNLQSEHPIDRSIIPNHFLNFVQTGELDLGLDPPANHVTSLGTWSFAELDRYFHGHYRSWARRAGDDAPPGSAANDLADALGSTSNPSQMTNLEAVLNALKGQMYTTESSGATDVTWNRWNRNPNQQNAQEALMSIRGMFGVFHYMHAIGPQRTAVLDDMLAALGNFDEVFAAVCTMHTPCKIFLTLRLVNRFLFIGVSK